MNKLESVIEKKLKNEVENKRNGLCIKLLPDFINGIPDRIVLLPVGKVYFVELKRKGESARKLQKWVHNRLQVLGFQVFIVDSDESLSEFIQSYELDKHQP